MVPVDSGALTKSATGVADAIAAQGAGWRTYLEHVVASNTSATGVRVDILDGATVKLSFWLPATTTLAFPVLFRGAANTAWRWDISAAVTDVRLTLTGRKKKEAA